MIHLDLRSTLILSINLRVIRGRPAAGCASGFAVAIAKGFHPFPFRTRPLSPSEPMVLHGKLCGRVGRCREI